MRADAPHNPAADKAVSFINRLTHTKGQWARQPFDLRPWQEPIIRRLFGTLRPDGLRQYRTAFIFLPRKNGKTELAAAIALYCLLADDEPGGEIYSAAVDREQASLVFRVAAQMVRNDPHLAKLCNIVDSQRSITYGPTQSVYRAIPADAPHAHGYNASAVIYDELHCAPNADLWNVMKTSQGARRQPLMVAITTAGHDRHSVAYQVYDYACKVRDGIIADETFLPVIYEAPKDADWRDEQVWRAANPALGDYRSLDEMRQACREAQEVPAREMTFRQLYLNQWTESATRWLSPESWDACQTNFTPEDLSGRTCYGGLDLASTTDTASFVLIFPGTPVSIVPFFWIPQDRMEERERRDRVPYRQWARQNLIVATEGNVIDYDVIRRDINRLREVFEIKKIAVDRWNATQLVTQLQGDGFDVVFFGQGFASMTAPTKELERRVISQQVTHEGNAVLRWMIGNTVVQTDAAGNMKPSKEKSTERIDGVVATIMALGISSDDPGESVYEQRGLIII